MYFIVFKSQDYESTLEMLAKVLLHVCTSVDERSSPESHIFINENLRTEYSRSSEHPAEAVRALREVVRQRCGESLSYDDAFRLLGYFIDRRLMSSQVHPESVRPRDWSLRSAVAPSTSGRRRAKPNPSPQTIMSTIS